MNTTDISYIISLNAEELLRLAATKPRYFIRSNAITKIKRQSFFGHQVDTENNLIRWRTITAP